MFLNGFYVFLEMIDICKDLKELMKWQMPAIEVAVQRNAWYLGEKCKRCVSEEMAMDDFLKNHLSIYWAKVFKALYCNFKCDYGHECSIAQDNEDLANMFKGDVYKKGIDNILSDGDETEVIFARFKRMTNNS